jgi:hypothetical protein
MPDVVDVLVLRNTPPELEWNDDGVIANEATKVKERRSYLARVHKVLHCKRVRCGGSHESKRTEVVSCSGPQSAALQACQMRGQGRLAMSRHHIEL